MSDTPIIIEPKGTATASVIWLHGLGASGDDFVPVVPYLPASVTQRTRFVFPHAPERPITINMGMVMRGWYDIAQINLTRQQDAEGVRDSEKLLTGYISAELDKGILAENIVLAGFSQGGAIALHTGLRYPARLAGIMALSTYLPLAETLEKERHAANADTPIFMGHGSRDGVISIQQAEDSRELLKTLGYTVEWHSYPMEHSVSPEEIQDIGVWLSTCLG